MNQRVKELYLKALDSGKYKEGKDRLHNSDGTFDALGVLCDIAVKERVIEKWENLGSGFAVEGEMLKLPKKVMMWAGMKTPNGRFPDDTEYGNDLPYSLAAMSDEGFPFIAIADAIEMFGDEL